MANEIAKPKMPGSASLVEREANRVVTRHQTIVDEADAIINEVLADPVRQAEWAKHNDPSFDDESQEGSVEIDKVRLADIAKEVAAENPGRYPLMHAALTHRAKQAVQAALSRTGESISKRRAKIKAVAAE